MKLEILHDGDHVLSVTSELIAIERANGEVEILPLIKGEGGYRVDSQKPLIIGYSEIIVQSETINGVTIMNF